MKLDRLNTHFVTEYSEEDMDLRFHFIVLLVCISKVLSQGVDMTFQIGATGPDVVQAVVDKIKDNCIYSNDRLFLRRLAYVESHDGLDKDTFRGGYYGGIWQVKCGVFF